jgi:hypothetical protein
VHRFPRNAKFQLQAFGTAAIIFLLACVAFLPQAVARDLANDPNLAQRVQQLTYKPAPGELLLKPKHSTGKHTKKPAKDADY